MIRSRTPTTVGIPGGTGKIGGREKIRIDRPKTRAPMASRMSPILTRSLSPCTACRRSVEVRAPIFEVGCASEGEDIPFEFPPSHEAGAWVAQMGRRWRGLLSLQLVARSEHRPARRAEAQRE